MQKADLHIHSNYSDGSDTVEELVENIKLSKLDVFALTDHDTVEGCEKISQLILDGIKFIPGVELTTIAGSIKCHILGYNCDYKNKTLLDLIEKGKVLRRNKLETRLKYLKEVWNIKLTQAELDWLYSRKSVVKTHIANVLVKRGLAADNLSAMQKYLDGCKAGDTRFTIEESVNAIIKSGGIPVWAHPLGGEGETHLSKGEFLPKLKIMINYGIKGLECYYSRYSLEESEFLVKCANENNLLISGGSDYNGKNKNNITLGMLNEQSCQINQNKLSLIKNICLKMLNKGIY